MTDDICTDYPTLYEQYPELYHEYPTVAKGIYKRIDEHGEEWVLENWYTEFLPAGVILNIPDKDELPFFDPDEHETWSDEQKAAMGEAYSTYRENLRKASKTSKVSRDTVADKTRRTGPTEHFDDEDRKRQHDGNDS